MTAGSRTSSAPTIGDELRRATARLTDAGRETPRLDAEVLLRHALGLDRTGLFLRLPEPLPADARTRYEALVARRLAGEPVAYLTGEREFMGLPFAVGPAVLIPRPETEILVEWAIDQLRERPTEGRRATVLDVGTGSGAIALALAHHLGTGRQLRFVAADRSAEALACAAINRSRFGLDDRVGLVRGDLAAWCRGPVDLLLANLPYLRPDQAASNLDLAAEPLHALVGGEDGLALVRRLVADAPRFLAPTGALGLEVDPSQTGATTALVAAALPDATVAILRDLAGRPRHIVAHRAQTGSGPVGAPSR